MRRSARLPRGDAVDDVSWGRRHRVLVGVLGVLAPVLLLVGSAAGAPVVATVVVAAVPLVAAVGGRVARGRCSGSVAVVLGLTLSCVAVVALSGGAGEAYWSFFVAAALLVLYQHWAPLAAVVVAAALGSLAAMLPLAVVGLPAAASPGPSSSVLHTGVVLLASGALVLLCGFLEREGVGRAHENATSRLLLDLARRNHDLPDRLVAILRDLEAVERDPAVLAELMRLDALAARLRRDADSLVVLSGRRPDRMRTEPTTLREILRAAAVETEYRDRVSVSADEWIRVVDRAVVDLTHVLAELVENAARSSPPETPIRLVARAHGWRPGAQQLVVTDAGAGLTEAERAAADRLLAGRDEADVAAPGVGLRVVSRLAARHRIEVSLRSSPTGGVAAVLVLPEALLLVADQPSPAGRHRWPSPEPVLGAPGTQRPDDVTAPEAGAQMDAEAAPVQSDGEVDGSAGEPAGPGGRQPWVAPVVVPSPRRGEPPSASSALPAPREPVDEPPDATAHPAPARRPTPLVTPKTVPAPPDPSSTS